ncbi:MAG: SBBP repeat-containing protein, partial [Spirulina sp.]
MLLTPTENGIDPGLNINLDWQSLSPASELSDPLQSQSHPPGSNSSSPSPERASPVWLKQLGSTDNDTVADVAVDRSGNIYMAGTTTGKLFSNLIYPSDRDPWLAKFNSSGELLWGKQIVTPENDGISRVAVDGMGNVYAAGIKDDVYGNKGAWLAKYDIKGRVLWMQQGLNSSATSISDLE